MLSLIGHAHDARTPAATAWLLSGAVAVGLLAVVMAARALTEVKRLNTVYQPLGVAMAVGAVSAILVGWARPAPWLIALLLVIVLSTVWAVAVRGFLLAGIWGAEQ